MNANDFLNSKGLLYTRELININDERINLIELLDEYKSLNNSDVRKYKFAIEWLRNVNYGIGSGTEYFEAESREKALSLFWKGKNKEAFDVNHIYQC